MANKYKQQADGRWHTRVWDGNYEKAKKHYVQLVSSKSSKDLERIVAEFIQKRDNGLIVASSTTGIQEYAREWLKVEKGLSQTATKAMYNNIIEVHLKSFYNIQFEYLTRHKIQTVINENSSKPRTCQQIYMTLKQICKSAEHDKLLPSGKTADLFDHIQLPKYKATEKEPLTDAQCKIIYNALVAHVMPPRSELFLALIYFCGLRREEALAVKIEDIHSFSVDINKALHLGAKKTEIKDPKTERGFRTVPLPPESVPIIKHALDNLAPNEDGFLITMTDGRNITKDGYDKMWKWIKVRLGIEFSAHQLRHTYCTRLCYEAYTNRTISVKQIAKLLGDTEKMVNEIYGHLVEEKEHTSKAIVNVFKVDSAPAAVNEM